MTKPISVINPYETLSKTIIERLENKDIAIQLYYNKDDEVMTMNIVDFDREMGRPGDHGRADLKDHNYEQSIEFVFNLLELIKSKFKENELKLSLDKEANDMIGSGKMPERVQFFIKRVFH